MASARNEMIKLTAMARVSKTIQMNAPASIDQYILIGDEILVYQETEKRWLGPYTTIDAHEKGVVVKVNGKRRPFSIDKVHQYVQNVVTQRSKSSHRRMPDTRIQAETAAQPDNTRPPLIRIATYEPNAVETRTVTISKDISGNPYFSSQCQHEHQSNKTYDRDDAIKMQLDQHSNARDQRKLW